jgi:hypothetical protein
VSEGGGTRIGLGLVAGACLLALLTFDGAGLGPAGSEPAETCGAVEPWVCVDDKPYCPTTLVCPEQTPGSVDPDSTTPAPVIVTQPNTTIGAPETTVVPVQPPSEAAPQPTEPPATEPPSGAPQPNREPETTEPVKVDTVPCARTSTVRAGDSWVTIADRGDVWTKDLLALNGATKATPLVVGQVVCLPPSVYGDGPAPTEAPQQTTPATEAPTIPAATVPDTVPPQTVPPTVAPPTTHAPPVTKPTTPKTTQPPQTSPPQTAAPPTSPPATPAPKVPQEPPKKPQNPGTNPAPTTTKPPCSVC